MAVFLCGGVPHLILSSKVRIFFSMMSSFDSVVVVVASSSSLVVDDVFSSFPKYCKSSGLM